MRHSLAFGSSYGGIHGYEAQVSIGGIGIQNSRISVFLLPFFPLGDILFCCDETRSADFVRVRLEGRRESSVGGETCCAFRALA